MKRCYHCEQRIVFPVFSDGPFPRPYCSRRCREVSAHREATFRNVVETHIRTMGVLDLELKELRAANAELNRVTS